MRWIFGAALLPFLGCGVMCLGGMALAFFGLKRSGETKPTSHHPDDIEAANEAASTRP